MKTAEEILDSKSRKIHNGLYPYFPLSEIYDAMEEYANQFKPTQEVKTLKECKDEIAKNNGYSGFMEMVGITRITNKFLVECCTLYACQFKPKPTQEWISVETELPAESGRYWCYIKEVNDLGISRYQWNCSYSVNENRWADENHNWPCVTHWMPLPPKPEI